jgi:hypothetical protein
MLIIVQDAIGTQAPDMLLLHVLVDRSAGAKINMLYLRTLAPRI